MKLKHKFRHLSKARKYALFQIIFGVSLLIVTVLYAAWGYYLLFTGLTRNAPAMIQGWDKTSAHSPLKIDGFVTSSLFTFGAVFRIGFILFNGIVLIMLALAIKFIFQGYFHWHDK